jgi:hypothetical protein
VQEVDAVEVRHVGQAVERASVGRCDEDVVMARVGQVGAEAAEDGLGDAVGRRSGLAYVSLEPGLIERVARDQTFADQRDAGRCRHCAGRQSGHQKAGSDEREAGESHTYGTRHEEYSFLMEVGLTKSRRGLLHQGVIAL